MSYPNLSAELTPEIVTTVRGHIQEATTALEGNLLNLTPDDIGGMYKMGNKRQSLGTACLDIGDNHSDILTGYTIGQTTGAHTDFDRHMRLLSLKNDVAELLKGIDHACMASGSEVMMYCKGVYAAVKAGAQQNIPGVAALYDTLKQHYDLPDQPDGDTPPDGEE